ISRVRVPRIHELSNGESHLDRLHELELKKQQGVEIDPDDFSPSEPGAPPKKPVASGATRPNDEEDDEDESDFQMDENDENDDDGDDEGGIAVATDRDPEVDWLDDGEHPLADNYRCAGSITLEEVWFYAHFRGIACHLMQREPDREIAEEPAPEE
ncbi:MAG: hypothetical protein ABI787_12870, partial [Spartobacteria bacterium]